MESTEDKPNAGKVGGQVLLALVLVLAAPALGQNAQKRPPRHVLVSIPDRKLAVLEDGKVIHTFPVAVGAAASPQSYR